ncbi:MocR-like pyridoxine biosynthesis transcription factor PdxR [Vibrio paucivorans]|uniref:PLP-dependent aminotransferase family protein n=1 Tax=Vibrio paucivorans TaxID=2829489 RepID=A0A9X3HP11_9VIBR|nr:PLP-dependent aminotransferase family protein [Vibrio paucivorans]MCW8332426.1 PLP-dependent aminotransferase family protein [Vibrio paucivorans]
MLEKYIHVDPNHQLSLQDQIKTAITQAIMNGFVDRDTPVTSSRKLAMSLKVSRNTVLRVYEQLNEEGFFVSKERKGYYVNPELVLHSARVTASATNELDWQQYLVTEADEHAQPTRELQDYPYRFVHGMVDESVFPVNEWRKCSIQSSNKANSKQWTSSNNDYDDLIEQIRTRVLPRRGIFVQADEILVTLGTQQSLYLISRTLTSKQTNVGIENPGYPEAYTQLSAKQSNVIPLAVDDKGLVVNDELAKCDLVYTTPSNQFPTSVRMPTERREQLIESAKTNDFLVVEDDYEHEVNFIDQDIPALKGEFTTERIIYLSSFSSTIAPGLRIGFVVAAAPFIKRAKELQRKSHSYPPQNNCQTLALFLSLGYYDALIQKLLKSLRSKWLTMEKALNYYFPQSGVVPSLAGTAFWINYTQGFDANKLAILAEKQGILINPGEQYYFTNACNNGFRLSFNSIEEVNIREGVRQLSQLAKQILPLERIENSEGEHLNGTQIREVLNSHQLLTSDCFNIPYRITFQADGRMYGMSDRPNDEDEGYWWVEENKMCYQWKTWQFADVRQLELVKNGSLLSRFDTDGYCVSRGELIALS